MEQLILDRPVSKLVNWNWEKALYITFIILALLTRLWNLGDRVPSHDESIHTLYSWNLYVGKGFAHHPLMHGPFQFHAAALSYFLFGDNDFTARIPAALMGVAIVLFPYLLRRWLGRAGALVTSFFLLISPSIAYYSRYIREDIPVLLWTLVAFLGMLLYLRDGRKRWLFLMAGGVSLMFATKEVAFIHNAIFGLFLVGLLVIQTLRQEWPNENLKSWFLAALLVIVVGLLAIGVGEVLRPPLPEEALPSEKQPVSLPLAEQPASLWQDVARNGGGLLVGFGFLAAVGLLLAGKLLQSDLKFSTPWVFALLTIITLGLLVLIADRWFDILLVRLDLPQSQAGWWTIWGRVMVWIALLAAGVFALFRYLIHKSLETPQLLAAVLIVVIVVTGVFLRLGVPVLLSYTSCAQQVSASPQYQENFWGCCQRTLQEFAWPEGGTRLLTWLPFTNGNGILINAYFMLTILPFAGGVVVGLTWLAVTAFRNNRAFDLVVLLGSLCLPFLSPLPMNLAGLRPMEYNPPTIYYTGAILIEVLLVSIAIGLLWDARRQMEGKPRHAWLTAAAIHYAIFVILFTTFLTNAYGIPSGLVGSLGYWLEQQEVERGSQPQYYYVIMVSLYEYLPLLLSLIAAIYLAIRGFLLPHLQPAIKRLGEFPAVREYFLPSVLWWVVLSWIGYSIAGERMPWLTVHLALPMILLSGWLVGRLLEEIDWQRVRQGKAWLLALLAPPLVIAIAMLVGALAAGPLQGQGLAQLRASGQLLNALLGLLACSAGLGYVIWRSGWRVATRILLLTGLLVPVFITIRTAWRFCYVNYDYPTEFLVYAHAAPGVREAVAEIDEISRRYGGGPYSIEVPYGSDASTMFHWQLRYYPPDYSFGENPSQEQLNAPVIVAGSADWATVDRYVGDKYVYRTYTYIWWPMQDYWNLTWDRIAYAITNPDVRAALWDIWYNRDYARYDKATGKTHTLDKWPLRGDFRLYIRRDVAAQVWDLSSKPEGELSLADPYAEGWQALTTRLVIGGAGTALGEFQNPRGIEIGPDGFLYVADTGNSRIQKFTPDGEFITAWTQDFLQPWDVDAAPDGTLYVADTWNHRIQHLDADGAPLDVWGTYGEYTTGGNVGQSAFYGPRGIVVGFNGRVYVADTGNKRIQVFEPDGKFVFQWGGGGALAGYLDEPVGIAIGPNDQVYVADTWNRRVQVFTRDGVFLRQWAIEGWDAQLVEEKYSLAPEEKPYLAVDANGYVYVTDPSNYRVLVFDSQGNYVLSFGKYGLDKGAFMLPTGIDVAEDGVIYVSDAYGSRIVVFDPPEKLKAKRAKEVAPPGLTYPADGEELIGGTVPLLGTGAPDSEVQVVVDGLSVGTTKVTEDGFWFMTIELNDPGAHTITLQSLTAGGITIPSVSVQVIIIAAK